MADKNRCSLKGCRRRAWGDSPFCFDHLISHVSGALPEPQAEELKARIAKLLKSLSYRERVILKLLYMSLAEDGYSYTLQQVGHIFKISGASVSRIEQRALQKLRRPVRFRELEDFIEVYSFDAPEYDFVQIIRLSEKEILRYLSTHPDDMHRLPSDTFEQIIAEIMASSGFDVQLTQRTRDGGRDIIAVSRDQFGIRTHYIVECKRYSPNRPVRVELVRSLYGVKQQQQADHAILATTSYFTKDAVDFCKSPSVWNLHLKGFEEIAEWVRAYDEMMQKGAILL